MNSAYCAVVGLSLGVHLVMPSADCIVVGLFLGVHLVMS